MGTPWRSVHQTQRQAEVLLPLLASRHRRCCKGVTRRGLLLTRGCRNGRISLTGNLSHAARWSMPCRSLPYRGAPRCLARYRVQHCSVLRSVQLPFCLLLSGMSSSTANTHASLSCANEVGPAHPPSRTCVRATGGTNNRGAHGHCRFCMHIP